MRAPTRAVGAFPSEWVRALARVSEPSRRAERLPQPAETPETEQLAGLTVLDSKRELCSTDTRACHSLADTQIPRRRRQVAVVAPKVGIRAASCRRRSPALRAGPCHQAPLAADHAAMAELRLHSFFCAPPRPFVPAPPHAADTQSCCGAAACRRPGWCARAHPTPSRSPSLPQIACRLSQRTTPPALEALVYGGREPMRASARLHRMARAGRPFRGRAAFAPSRRG